MGQAEERWRKGDEREKDIGVEKAPTGGGGGCANAVSNKAACQFRREIGKREADREGGNGRAKVWKEKSQTIVMK